MPSKVPFGMGSIKKCICPECPVQEKSQCVIGLKQGLPEVLKHNPLKPEVVPGVYCGTGKAACTDLNTRQSCICGGCPVFAQYQLAAGRPVGYYCREGAAS